MDAEVKRILCESAINELTLIKEDKGVSYYTKARLWGPSEEQKKLKKGEAYAFITSPVSISIESVFTANVDEDDTLIEWTVVGVSSLVREHMYRGNDTSRSIVSIPATIEYIAMKGKGACYGFLFEVDEKNSKYKSVIDSFVDGAVFSKNDTELLTCESKMPNPSYFKGVKKIGHIGIDKDCDITIPSSIEVINSAHLRCGTIKFEGLLPELEDFSDVRAEKIYVNQPFKVIPKDRFEKIYNVKNGDKDYFRAEIITKKPELSTEVPQTPGFIGLTRVDNDEYEYINPRYIIKMMPISFEKYDGVEIGTRVLFAAHDSQRAFSVDYYEELSEVDRKIKDAQEALAHNIGGLAGLLEIVKDLYEVSQTKDKSL